MEDLAIVGALCGWAVLSALVVAFAARPVHAALGLLAHSLSLAAMYLYLSAQLMAVAQIMIYSGAIVVLFLFVVALLPKGGREEKVPPLRILASLGLLIAAATSVFLIMPANGFGEFKDTVLDSRAVGRLLFDSKALLIPFELTAPLLLAAILGAVALWRRQESD